MACALIRPNLQRHEAVMVASGYDEQVTPHPRSSLGHPLPSERARNRKFPPSPHARREESKMRALSLGERVPEGRGRVRGHVPLT
jgi:hypothetical protein